MQGHELCPGLYASLRRDPALALGLWRANFEAALRLEQRGQFRRALPLARFALASARLSLSTAGRECHAAAIRARHSARLYHRLQIAREFPTDCQFPVAQQASCPT